MNFAEGNSWETGTDDEIVQHQNCDYQNESRPLFGSGYWPQQEAMDHGKYNFPIWHGNMSFYTSNKLSGVIFLRLRHNRHVVVCPCAQSVKCCRWAAGLYMHLAFNLSLSPLDLLQLHMQIFILHRQCLHALLETVALLLRPSQLVAVYLVLCGQTDSI